MQGMCRTLIYRNWPETVSNCKRVDTMVMSAKWPGNASCVTILRKPSQTGFVITVIHANK